VSSSFRRSIRLGELILAPGASKRCPLPLTTDVRLQGVINVEFFLRNGRNCSLVSAYEIIITTTTIIIIIIIIIITIIFIHKKI